jgi:GT2 family glycosyltransferase
MNRNHNRDLAKLLLQVEQVEFDLIDTVDRSNQRQRRIALKEFNRQLAEKNLVIKKLQDEVRALQTTGISPDTSEILSLNATSETSHHSESVTGSWFDEKKVTVYTVQLHGIPRLESIPSELTAGLAFICFSDSPAEIPAGWEYRPISFWGSSDNATVSWAKSHPDLLLKGHEFSLWLEPNQVTRLMKNLSQFHVDEFADSYSTVVTSGVTDLTKLLSDISNVSLDLADSLQSIQVSQASLLDSRLILQRVDSPIFKRLNRLAWKILLSSDLTDDECWTLSALAIDVQVQGISETGLQKKKAPNHPPLGKLPNTGKFFRSPQQVIPKHPHLARSILIPVFNSPDDTRRCLSSVLSTMAPDDELIIVDDSSEDETEKICQDFSADSRVRLFRNQKNLGYSKSANFAFSLATYHHVVLLNSDTVVSAGWLDKLQRHLQNDPDLAAVGPVSNNAQAQSIPHQIIGDNLEDDQVTSFVKPQLLNEFLHFWSQGTELLRAESLNGFCIMFNTRSVTEMGLFDTVAYPRGYGEELDWCIRVVDAGYSLGVALDTYVYHAKGKSFPSADRLILKEQAHKILNRKYGKKRLDSVGKCVRLSPHLTALRLLSGLFIKFHEDED